MKIKNSFFAILIGVLLLHSGCSTSDIPTPTVNTAEIASITERTVVAGGIISTDNGSMITARGVCWSTSPNPTIKDNKLEATGDGTGEFFCSITSLNPITTYYLRAYATNAGGTAYGEQVTFITKAFELTTIPPSFITATSAISGGLVSFDTDRPDATSRGVCWNKFPNPIMTDNRTLDGAGKGSFTSTMTGLEPYTTYYVRAYISNNDGIIYGNEQQFTTQNGVIGIVTEDVASITSTTASLSATISGDGGASISDRGFCWNTTANPTVSSNKVSVGNGTGSYSSILTGLEANTMYYVRSYASNSFGTIYGNENSFSTLVGVPKACFECASNVGFTAAFTNCSDYPTSCLWDFGDGTTSIDNTPTHVFNSVGTYTVKLVVSNGGLSDFVTKVITITDVVSLNNIQAASEFSNGTHLDVDLDGIADFRFSIWQNLSPSESNAYSRIEPLNNYEIITDTASTRVTNYNTDPINSTYLSTIPKIYVLGNTIQPPFTTTKSGLFIANKQYLMVGKNSVCDIWITSETRYIGFRKVEGNITKIGWIKLGVPGFVTVVLCSFKIPSITESLNIK